MSFRQDRTNPSTAISNWRGRSDTPKAWPSTQVDTWMNGGLFGGGGLELSYTGTVFYDLPFSDGYNYFGCETSGTLTFSADATIDIIVVGGGGGNDRGVVGQPMEYNGGGGGGGTVAIDDLDVTAGDYVIVIGAKGTQGTTSTSTGTDGGDTYLTIGGVYMAGGGGGRGGMGGGTAQAGTVGRPSPTSGSVYRGSGGGGGGGGVYPWNAGSAGGSGGSYATGGSLPSGTVVITNDGGNGGGPNYTDSQGGGGGNGIGGSGNSSGQGYEGKLWNGYSTATERYGQGGQATSSTGTTPNGYNQNVGGYGKGGSQYHGIGNNGIVIIRWAP